ncbi:hypothetical protein SDRG_02630 [Saprolegnia diclina VS20]|uniref:Anaphase-promoting complex subunit 4 WD40 domain-containing protein n=1 Tax=Saprolegnia diclina (strain VS20) TaxID=1156394 RepID=T0R125_SAPDV|nr:hypothetical protein SDRG_02630 [Saprolegnia diclina VS20]EQC39975.1 hypothetical protein SDRG_02630 [Saprolegnia diclina VS20]|eukprot:XP_008606449.1 hypothetical protein SDRG_02630 [Saprolegnia diclina VS20]
MAAHLEKHAAVGAVTALHFSPDGSLLYACVGSTVYFYDTATGCQVHALTAMRNGTVHGLDVADPVAALFGQKMLAVLAHAPSSPADDMRRMHVVQKEFPDWILDARLLSNEPTAAGALPLVAVGMAHNLVHVWNPTTDAIVHSVRCSERSILYAMGLYGRSLDSLVVAAGTVFQHILLWNPMGDGQPVQRLHQHDGVLFKLQWSDDGQRLASVSDDRSVQLWANGSTGVTSPTTTLSRPFESVFRGWGHTARIWDVKFTSLGLVTASEDATCKLWDLSTSQCVATLHGHTDVNVWRLAVHPSQPHLIASGGGDNAVKTWDLRLHVFNQAPPAVTLPSVHATVRAMAMTKTHVYAITDKSTLVAQALAVGAAPSSVALTYNACSLDTSDDDGVIAVGDVRGVVHIYDAQLQSLLEWQAHATSRVLYVWLHAPNRVLTSSVDMHLHEWALDVTTKTVTLLRSVTSRTPKACVSSYAFTDDAGLWTGDSRGNLAYYTAQSSSPTHVLAHAHGDDIVSSVLWRDNKLYSTGHDGYLTVTERVNGVFAITRKQSIKGLATLKRVWFEGDDLLVFGFHAKTAHIVNVSQSFRRVSVTTGGWRSPHALRVACATDHALCVGQKDTILLHASSSLLEATRPTTSVHGQMHHSKTACCVEWDPVTKLLLTGGEDNALKVYAYDTQRQVLDCIDSVSMHTTNIRALAVTDNYVLSAGGKQSVHVWRLHEKRLQHVGEHTPSDAPQDQRILALAATQLGDGHTLAFAGSSEGAVTALLIDTAGHIHVAGVFGTSTQKPILSCGLYHEANTLYLATGATDGKVVLWHLTDAVATSNYTALTPAYVYTAHDMGVNCLSVLADGPSRFHIVTGGDDQCIAHATLTLASDGGLAETTHHAGVRNASASALKAIRCVGNVVVAGGYDQRVTVWRWNDSRSALKWAAAALSETADIAGLGVYEALDATALQIVAVGKGLQVCTFTEE